MHLFGTSGIRGIADKNLVSLAFKVGLATGAVYHDVAVGGDTRTSSGALKHAVISGLLAAGAECYDVGTVPTPTLACAARDFEAGIMVTASHNPPEYNGMKLLNPDGDAFDPIQQKQIEKLISGDLNVAPWDKLKSSRTYVGAIEQHLDRILKSFPVELKLKVVVDAGCGAASLVTPYLLRKLGCEVLALDCYPSGFFPHTIEPTESNLGNLMKATREFGADLGIAHDGDADRMMAVDKRGRFITGDKLLVIFARAITAKEVVTTLDASMSIEEMGFKVHRTRVGDNYVSQALRGGGQFGGETSGAWVFPRISLCPDGIYAAAQMAAIASQQDLAAMVDGIPSYPLLRGSASSDGVEMSRLEPGLMALEPLSVSKLDGIKLNFKDGWLLVRASGTEPKIRLTAEARDEATVRRLYDSGLAAIRDAREKG
ncbi:MAG: phosphoglucosamine mutase [Chloroflexi bacterium]|nr:phosphoglucosamine mutase [Chloroflexota bacterium]